MAQIAPAPVPSRLGVYAAVIANNASLSDGIDLKGYTLCGVEMPADWTDANLTFQGRTKGGIWSNVYDRYGNELVVVADDDRYIPIDPLDFLGVEEIKVRSGTSGSAVNQSAARTINLAVRAL